MVPASEREAPRIDQINVVVTDVAAAAEFLHALGVEVPRMASGWEGWGAHHRSVPAARPQGDEPGFGIDLDSSRFAGHWGGLPESFTGVVLDLRVDGRTEVDRLHELAVSLGARSLRAPHDAFWGSRFCLVEGPGPLHVGIMSGRSDAHRSTAPDLAEFA